MLPNELIDKILIMLNDMKLAIKLKRDFVTNKLHKINQYSIDGACIYGHLDVIKWLYNNGAKYSYFAKGNAAVGGHVDVLEYLHSIGDNIDSSFFEVANNCSKYMNFSTRKN